MDNITKILIIYLILTNIVGFAIMGIDKYKAQNHKWRIKENTLFLIAIIGGSVGSIIGMNCFRHKTKHKKFKIGMPIIAILQIIVLSCIYIHGRAL